MPDKLLIIMSNSDPSSSCELAPPLLQASMAATMEYDVEVILTGRSSELARKGVAERVAIQPGSSRTIYDVIREAADAGTVFKVCSTTLEAAEGELIPEIREAVGAAYLISEAMDPATVTFTY